MKKSDFIFFGSSFMASGIGQEQLVPALLADKGWEITEEHCYAPGQTLSDHVENNKGNLTRQQVEGIEKGRIGGWFDDDKCDFLYETYRSKKGNIDRALNARKYDVAFVLADAHSPDELETFKYGKELIEMLRENNPDIKIIIDIAWTYLGQEEMLPQYLWVGERLALENNCILSPVGLAFAKSKEIQPEIFLHRSKKDSHQNEISSFLIAYTLIAALDIDPVGLPNEVHGLQKSYDFAGRDFYIDEKTAKKFQAIARNVTTQANKDISDKRLENLVRPVIEKAGSKIKVEDADKKILVIGNAYFDNDGKLWDELSNSYKVRDNVALYIEEHTDDAATFESILANNKGIFTSRQQRIIDTIRNNFRKMEDGEYDMDELDGMGDYSLDKAIEFILNRKSKLDTVLNKNIKWDAIILQGFRGALNPEDHDFFAKGDELISKAKTVCPDSQIKLMQHWAYKDAPSNDQTTINNNYKKLAKKNDVKIIPVGEKWNNRKNINLYSSKYTPNATGVQLTVETIRDFIL